ncbi:Os07g0165300 [Oryza sativa Japonica Group]|uniref:Os07g0165300 protein n=1 Tax=Oryza sativa subsp. japonica TaxID=39947 RepID=A0A0P0X2V0_ORYSJ|nr:uncharacterized protein LOC107276387 [Oryza sativa Japonica Group]KAB8104432.1 hypothetical protein EE612_037339 [Oryza sativa]BAT00200.1 Os07g0165300 [Oryza sativa Japonica Group]
MDSDDHPPEFIIHVVDDLAPPPPPPPRAQPALVPPRILPLPPPAFHGAAVQRRRPRPPPRDEATNNRTLLFVFQVCMFTMMVINLSIAIYLTVHPSPEESIADERSGVRMTCVFIIRYGDKCLCIDEKEHDLDPLLIPTIS